MAEFALVLLTWKMGALIESSPKIGEAIFTGTLIRWLSIGIEIPFFIFINMRMLVKWNDRMTTTKAQTQRE